MAGTPVPVQDSRAYQCNLMLPTVSIPSLLLGQDLPPLPFQLFLPLSSISALYSWLLPDTLENIRLVNPVCEALKPETTPWFLSFIYYLSGRLLKAMISVQHKDWVAHKTAQLRHVAALESCVGRTAVSRVKERKAGCGECKGQVLCPGSVSEV